MWIMTSFGFFCVVSRPGDEEGGTRTVQGRVKADLEQLRDRYLPGAGAITEDRRGECRYSFRVGAAELTSALAGIAGEIDYDSLCSAVKERQGWARFDIYDQVRAILRDLSRCDQYQSPP